MRWKQRGARVVASFVTGYTGGLGVTLPISALQNEVTLSLGSILFYPCMSGFIAALPQIGKIFNELSEMK